MTTREDTTPCQECDGLGWQGPPGNAEDCEICSGTGLASEDCGDNDMTTREDEIRARLLDRTQGKWRWHWRPDDEHAPGSIFAEPREGQAYAVAMCPRYGKEQFPNDADFIAHAPEDIAYLLGEVKRLNALVGGLDKTEAQGN